MDFTKLDSATQDLYLAWENDLRSLCGLAQQLLTALDLLEVRYQAQIVDLLKTLDAVALPVASGLGGVSALTPAEVTSLVDTYQAALLAFNTDAAKRLRAKAAGQAISR